MKENQSMELEEIVEIMMKEENHNPRKYCFNYITSKYPKSCHEAFNFPGKYIKSMQREFYTQDGTKMQMDVGELVGADDSISQKSTINVELQTTPLNQGKIDLIYDYKIFLIYKTHLSSISIVITNLKQDKLMKCYETYNNVFNIYYIVVSKDDICEKINILKDLLKNRSKISEVEAMYYPYIAILVEDNMAKEIMEETAHIFNQMKIKDKNLLLDTHLILKVMIKEHFKDDKQKTRELLTIITEVIDKSDYKKLIREEQFEHDLNIKDEIIANRDETISKKDKEIEDLKRQLNVSKDK